MNNELADRQLAIQWRLAGESVEAICQRLKRSEMWFHKWWRRYAAEGADGLFDLLRVPQAVVDRISPQIEHTIVSIRRRLEAHATSDTRYQRIGAPIIQAALAAGGQSSLAAAGGAQNKTTTGAGKVKPKTLTRTLPQAFWKKV